MKKFLQRWFTMCENAHAKLEIEKQTLQPTMLSVEEFDCLLKTPKDKKNAVYHNEYEPLLGDFNDIEHLFGNDFNNS